MALITCPKCGSVLSTPVNFCDHCGSDLTTISEAAEAAAAAEQAAAEALKAQTASAPKKSAMDTLKKFFPLARMCNSVGSFIGGLLITIALYFLWIAISAIGGFICGLLIYAVIGIILTPIWLVIVSLVSLYIQASFVIQIVAFCIANSQKNKA